MSYQEKLNITELISLIITSTIYAYIIYLKYQALGLNSTNDFKFWGTSIAILFFVLLLSQILGYIAFLIINSFINKNKAIMLEDEFDKIIDRKAVNISFYIFATGFFASMGLMIFNLPPRATFISMSICFIVASACAFISKIVMYRRGV